MFRSCCFIMLWQISLANAMREYSCFSWICELSAEANSTQECRMAERRMAESCPSMYCSTGLFFIAHRLFVCFWHTGSIFCLCTRGFWQSRFFIRKWRREAKLRSYGSFLLLDSALPDFYSEFNARMFVPFDDRLIWVFANRQQRRVQSRDVWSGA